MTAAPAFPITSSLEAGLLADCARLIEFEAELSTALDESHELANVRGSPEDWNTSCHHQWDHVMVVMRRIHQLVVALHDAVGAGQPQVAQATWEEMKKLEAELSSAVSGLREQAAHLNEAAAMDWKTLILTIESHRKAVQAGIQGLQIRLESWAAHRQPDETVKTVLVPAEERPGAEDMDAATYTQKFDAAAIEIGSEQHREMGLLDGVKALFMWVETPGERVRKNHGGTAPAASAITPVV